MEFVSGAMNRQNGPDSCQNGPNSSQNGPYSCQNGAVVNRSFMILLFSYIDPLIYSFFISPMSNFCWKVCLILMMTGC